MIQYLQQNDIIAGKIIKLTEKGALVNVGSKKLAFLPRNESLQPFNNNLIKYEKLQEFLIIWVNPRYPELILSTKKLKYSLNSVKLLKFYDEKFFLFTRLLFWNRGGILTNLEGIRTFLPQSHVPKLYKSKVIKNIIIPTKILNYVYPSKKITLSCRAMFFRLYYDNVKLLTFNSLSPTFYDAFIVKIKPFGVLVNLYGSPSLIYRSNLIFAYFSFTSAYVHLKKHYHVGQRIKIEVLRIDFAKRFYKLQESSFSNH